MTRPNDSPRKIKVLYVEDHTDTLYAVQVTLVKRGYEVLTATDVKSGIEIGTKNVFDVLLADIGLPDGKGWEVLDALRKIKSFPALALSAYCTSADEANFKAHGFLRCIAKPYDMTFLVDSIDEAYWTHAQSQAGTTMGK